MDRRGISPAVGVVVLIVITLLLASTFAVGLAEMTDFGTERREVDDLTDGTGAAASGDGYRSEDGGYRSELIWARDDDAGATTAHVVNYPIAPGSDNVGDSLNTIEIRYPDGSASVANLDERSDVEMVGIDEDRDGRVETNATGDVEKPSNGGVKPSDDGHTLTIELSGNYNIEGGDAIVVEYAAVENPGADDYEVTVVVNQDDDGRTGTLEIGG